MRGFIFYRGPSLLDGRPIVGIVTTKSKNRKTGKIAQTWILRDRIDPVRAVQTGGDASICGDCPHRRNAKTKRRTCYVNVGQAPLAIWRAYKRGSYETLSEKHEKYFTRRPLGLRYGAYGDPTAIPRDAWAMLERWCKGKKVGYTHQWGQMRFDNWKDVLMASVDDAAGASLAHYVGWRTFRVVRTYAQMKVNEIVCPSVRGTLCADCGACNGARQNDGRKNVVIEAHGPSRKFIPLEVVR